MKRSILPSLIVASAALLAACGTTVTGQPTTAPSSTGTSTSEAPVTVPAGLDTGTFPITAQPLPAPTTEAAWVVEGNRMGDDALIQVNEVDPRLIMGGAIMRSYPVLSGNDLVERVPDATATAFAANSMRVGMTTTRGDKLDSPTVAVRIGLYRFDDPQTALKALEDVRRATTAQPRVAITGTDNVLAGEFKPGTVDTYRTEGPFVINISGTGPTTDEGAALVAKAYQAELPKLKAFQPTATDRVATLPTDVDAIVSRTLPLDGTESTPLLLVGHYGLNGVLHRIADISKDADYRNAGIDLVGQRGNVVYRTRDATAATALAAGLNGRNQQISGIPQLPSVTCGTHRTTNYTWCYVPVGRYLSTVSDRTEATAKQKAAAQFTVLATTK